VDTRWLQHGDLVIANAEAAEESLDESENYRRAYLGTFQSQFLKSLNAAANSAQKRLRDLAMMVRDDPSQMQTVEKIASLATRWRELTSEEIQTRKARINEPREVQRSIETMEGIHKQFRTFLDYERQLRNKRTEKSQRSNRDMIIFVLIIGPLVGVMVGAIGLREIESLSRRYDVALNQAEASRTKAEEANEAKDQFMSMVAHELRNPLNALSLSARVLRKDPDLPENLGRPLDAIDRAVKTIDSMASDLIDSTRIASGQLRLNSEPIDLVSVVQSAVELMQPTTEAKDLQLATRIEVAAAPIIGDRHRLQDSVCNLLGNAVKFTPPGGTVELALNAADHGFKISVTDTGVGIDPQFLPRVFERFAQESSSTERRGGLGLGLAIVKHLIQLHGGTVSASSDGPGRGAQFTIYLPASQSSRRS
jgi:signal transduction histidine kinase